ncbi:MAG: class I SAM-dependent methyltransferase [candidate division Zixibacteria bacterium]|nr:class I SAM-dependent methyltransferase [candidate division Zixibacteria bacterium]
MDKEKLTEERYWDSRYKRASGKESSASGKSFKARLFDRYFSKIKNGYPSYLLFNVFCKKYFPEDQQKIIEIGSAPGKNLVNLSKIFDYIPYGVEYTESGVEANRELFKKNGLDEDNIILADFFDEKFQAEYNDQFDIVMSLGFIEHFEDPRDVVEKHINLIKPGGYLLVAIPNFRGINYLLSSYFCRHTLKAHNLEIMKKKNFISLFDSGKLEIVKSRFYGTLNFGLIYGLNKSPFKLKLMYLFLFFQKLFDIFFYTFFRKGGIDSSLFSPYQMMICQKITK